MFIYNMLSICSVLFCNIKNFTIVLPELRCLRWQSSLALFSNIKGSRRRRLPLMFEKSAKLDCHLKLEYRLCTCLVFKGALQFSAFFKHQRKPPSAASFDV